MNRDYAWLRANAGSGDVLLVESRRVGGTAIRMLTGQQFSHVAMLIWNEGGLWVAEMLGRGGYTLTPASERLPEMCKGAHLYFGEAPEAVTTQPGIVTRTALKYRGSRYSWWTLISVWFSQVTRSKTPNGLVCSTFVQRVWEACGITFSQTADPGDFLGLATSVSRIEIC